MRTAQVIGAAIAHDVVRDFEDVMTVPRDRVLSINSMAPAVEWRRHRGELARDGQPLIRYRRLKTYLCSADIRDVPPTLDQAASGSRRYS